MDIPKIKTLPKVIKTRMSAVIKCPFDCFLHYNPYYPIFINFFWKLSKQKKTETDVRSLTDLSVNNYMDKFTIRESYKS